MYTGGVADDDPRPSLTGINIIINVLVEPLSKGQHFVPCMGLSSFRRLKCIAYMLLGKLELIVLRRDRGRPFLGGFFIRGFTVYVM